jgi:hypothetical protein
LGGNKGSSEGLNRALKRAGLPGLGHGGYASDGDSPSQHIQDVDDIPADGKKGSPYQNGGYVVWTEDYVEYWGFGSGDKAKLVAIVPQTWLKDPNPMDDGTSGPGSPPLDGAGHVRPPGDVLGLEGEIGRPVGGKGNLTQLGKINMHANLGNSSTPARQLHAATDPDPSGDGGDAGEADAGDLKEIIDSNDAAIDPSPEHPLSQSGKAASKNIGH